MKECLSKTIAQLPHTPGVYLFQDADKKILYIGKATDLRSRVGQYFYGNDTRGTRIARLVAQTNHIETRQTDNVLDALLLEATLIKKYQPRYNIEGKDDKTFSYFVITHEKFPRIIIVRETDFTKERFKTSLYAKGKKFGPYTSREHMRIALKIIRKIFPFHNRAEKTEKGCLAYQIGLCPGPYAGAISEKEYKRNIRNISLFLSGRKKQLLRDLEREMKECAQKEEFEKAQKIKKQIFAINHINDVALMKKERKNSTQKGMRVEAYDISHIGGDFTVGAMVVSINGVIDKSLYRKFKIKAIKGIDDIAAMREMLARRANHFGDWGVPDLIVLDGGQSHLHMAEGLWQNLGVAIPIIAVAKGPTRKKVEIYESASFPADKKIIKDKDLFEMLREEAHRFAITYHKKLRKKHFLQHKKL